MSDKLRIDQNSLTLREMAAIEKELGRPLGESFGSSHAEAMAALAWITKRRDDPTFTFDQALDLQLDDLDLVTPGSPGEAPSGGNGAPPLASLEPGP